MKQPLTPLATLVLLIGATAVLTACSEREKPRVTPPAPRAETQQSAKATRAKLGSSTKRPWGYGKPLTLPSASGAPATK